MSKSNLDPTQEILNNMFGRTIYGHFQEMYKEAFRVLCENGELFTELQKFTEEYRNRYIKYKDSNNDHQFSFNEAYDEVVALIKAEYGSNDNDEIILFNTEESKTSFFDLDVNNYIDSATLN